MIVSYKVDNVKSIVVPPKKVVQNEDSARQYNKFCKEDVTKSVLEKKLFFFLPA